MGKTDFVSLLPSLARNLPLVNGQLMWKLVEVIRMKA